MDRIKCIECGNVIDREEIKKNKVYVDKDYCYECWTEIMNECFFD